MSLNDLLCKHAKPQSKPYKLNDKAGLYLQVMPKGGRYWRFKYSYFGKPKCLSIGVYPDISLAEAREALLKAKQLLKQNIDPHLDQKKQKQLGRYEASQTFEAIAREWHELNRDTWTEKHAAYVLRRLELHTFGQIGHYPLNQLTSAVTMACIQKIEKNAPEMARRVLNMCSRIFHYAGTTGRIDKDLTFGLKYGLKRFTAGHYASITLDELPDLLKSIHANKARLYPQTLLCLRLMLLTFVRTSELINAQWSEFDFDKAMWTIPKERMKTRKLHKVPLSFQSLEILRELKSLNGKRDFVFPSIPRPRKPMSNGTILKALERMGYKNKMTGHGFRSLAMGILKQNLHYRHEPVDRQLAHVPKNSVDRAYDRSDYLPQRIEMMQVYADYLDNITANQQQHRSINDRQKTRSAGQWNITSHAQINFAGGNQNFQSQHVHLVQRDENRTLSEALQG